MEDISEGPGENTHADDNGVTGVMDTKNKMRRGVSCPSQLGGRSLGQLELHGDLRPEG